MPFFLPGSQGRGCYKRLQKILGPSCPSSLLSSSLLCVHKFKFCFYRRCTTSSTHLESPQPCFHCLQLSGTAPLSPFSFCKFINSDLMKLQKRAMTKNDAMRLSNLLYTPFPPPHTHTHTHTHTHSPRCETLDKLLNLPEPT